MKGIGIGIGAKIWLWVCGAGNAAMMLFLATMLSDSFSRMAPSAIFVAIAMIVGYAIFAACHIIIAVWQKRWPFYVIVIVTTLVVAINFFMGNGIASFSGLINPTITFFVLLKDWDWLY